MSDTSLLEQIRDGILRLSPDTSAPAKPGAAKPASGGGLVETFITNLGAVTTGLGNLAKQFVTIADAGLKLQVAWDTASQKIGDEAKGAMATLARYGGGPLANIGNAAVDQSKQSMANSAAGIGGGGFMDMTIRLRDAGLTLEDYKNAMAASKGALNNFGANANQRAEQLTGVGIKMQEAAMSSERWSHLSEQIPKEEMAKIMLLSQMGRKEELASDEAKKKAAGSALALADQINRVAASSGKNRTVIEKELEARLASAEVQAQLVGASEEQRKAIIASQAAISGMGKGAGDAAQIIQAGGRLSQDNQIQLMSMGPKAMGEFIKGNQLMAKAKTDQEREAAQAILDRAKVDTAEYQKTKGFQRLLQSAPDNLRQGLRTSYEENLERGGVNAAQANRAPGQSAVDAEKERMTGVKNLTQSKLETGAPNPQAAGQQRMTELNNAAFRSAGESLGVLNKEITKLASSKSGIEVWGKAIEKVYGKGGDVEKSLNVILNAGQKILGSTTPGGGTATGTGTARDAPSNTRKPKLPELRATGGPIAPDDLYMVGEKGPELFKSKTAGDIIPTDKFQSMFGDIKTKISSLNSPNSAIPKSTEAKSPPLLPEAYVRSLMASRTPDKLAPSANDNALKIDPSVFKNAFAANKDAALNADTSKASIPKFELPKFELPKIDRTSVTPMAAPKIDAPRFDPSTMSRADQDQAKKAERDAAEATSLSKQQATVTKSPEPMPTAGGTVSMKDLNDSLIRLNSSMDKMLKATLDISSHSEKTAKNSGKATGNRTHA